MKGRYFTTGELRRDAYYERKEQRSGDNLRACWYCFVGFIIVLCMAACFSGCTTTKVIEVQTVKHDTTYVSKIQKDSVWLHDSIYVQKSGDTLLIEKWHTKWKEILQIDTVYQARVDSVPVPYEVIKEVEKKLSWWQRTQMIAGDVLLAVLFGLFCFGVWKLLKKFSII